MRRHGSIGHELVLATVPQLRVEEDPLFDLQSYLDAKRKKERKEKRKQEKEEERMQDINDRLTAGVLISSSEMAAWRRWTGLEPSSSTAGIKRKKRKRRKKKLPKTHSSSSFLCHSSSRGGAGDEGCMHEYEFEDVCADVPRNIHTVHAEPLNSVHIKEVTGDTGMVGNAPGMEEANKIIEKKVLRGGNHPQ